MNKHNSEFSLSLKRVFKMHFAATAAVALLVQVVVHLWPDVCGYSIFGDQLGVCRANYYFIIFYLFLMPLFLIKAKSEIGLLVIESEEKESLAKKIIRKVFAWVFLPFLIFTPLFFLSKQHYLAFSNQLIYGLMTETLFGLVVSGAFMTFGAFLCAWVLLTNYPIIKFKRK